MRIASHPVVQPLAAWFMTLLLVLPLAAGQSTSSKPQPQDLAQDSGSTSGAPVQVNSPPLPDSPGATPAQSPAHGQTTSNPEAQAPAPQQGAVQKPLGTAAAGVVSTTGVAASRPEGAALAPAKQRRVHLLIIKLGVVAAAGVALGATMALTAASPGRPPGSH